MCRVHVFTVRLHDLMAGSLALWGVMLGSCDCVTAATTEWFAVLLCIHVHELVCVLHLVHIYICIAYTYHQLQHTIIVTGADHEDFNDS